MNEMLQKLKDHINTIDWSKVTAPSDGRNAAIGAALGGLILGGASLAREKDPDESKLTPVGDALIGALAGGAAGYGIPRGLSLFRNGASPNTRPDFWTWAGVRDRWLPAAGRGALWGEGLFGIRTANDLLAARSRAAGRIRSVLGNGLSVDAAKSRVQHAIKKLEEARQNNPGNTGLIRRLSRTVDSMKARADAFLDPKAYNDALAKLEDRINAAAPDAVGRLKRLRDILVSNREQVAGMSLTKKDTYAKIWRELARMSPEKRPYGKPGTWLRTFWQNRSGGYAGHPVRKMVTRGGVKYPLAAALLNIALEGMMPSNRNNFAPGKD